MPRPDGPPSDIVVVGAGAFGLSIALRLARGGLRVRVVDETKGAPNASAVAAGMLAPVGETLAEGGDREHLQRLLDARDLWPAFSEGVPGLDVDRAHSQLLADDPARLDRIIAPLRAWGIDFARLPPPRLGVAIEDDWRVDAPAALAALRRALAALDVGIQTGMATAAEDGGLLVDGRPLEAKAVVIAAGYGSQALAAAAPELVALAPIKGQLVAFQGGGSIGPTLRSDRLYVVPQTSGARAGATMRPGEDDAMVDEAIAHRQREAAIALLPDLAGATWRGEAGVRAATPDGWPLAGASARPGLFLATGARRNGWLLAPLVSRLVADAITGAEPHPLADAFHPGRFTR